MQDMSMNDDMSVTSYFETELSDLRRAREILELKL
jgi:hypothetical protein